MATIDRVLTWSPETVKPAVDRQGPETQPISLAELRELFDSLRDDDAAEAPRLRIAPRADTR